MANLDTLVEDIHELLNGKLITDDEVIERFGREVGDLLQKRLSSAKEERLPTLRMSNIGRPLRQLWYELKGYPQAPLTGQTRFKFLYGDIIEALTLSLAEAAGHKVERQQEEIEVDGIKGHIDAVIDGEVVDVKSCSSYSFKKFETGTLFFDDPFGYIGQLSGYASALKLPARFIAVDKVVGNICTLPLGEVYYDVQGRIHQARDAVSRDEPPERCYEPQPVSKTDKSGNLVLGLGCSYCGWKESCWSSANQGQGLKTYYYSTGPKFFVEVKKEPRVKTRDEQQEET